MNVLAIDPGNKKSAWLVWDGKTVLSKGYEDNEIVLARVKDDMAAHMAIEMVQSFGMAVGAEVFETVYFIGRFCQACPRPFTRITRGEIKMHLCHSMRAKDSNIRQRLIDLLGQPGKKSAPGVTYGISGDLWSALAVAYVFMDRIADKEKGV